ncbi:MAG: hypothetical protein J6D52_11485 [Clostridia bacterium]|nr:hypothetical protein [Clostridia bacterium]
MISKHKNKIIIISIAVIGVALILLGSFDFGKDTSSYQEFQYEKYTEEIEDKLEKFLLTVNGITKARVIITLDTSYEQVLAQNQSNTNLFTISSGGSQLPVSITELTPAIRGVAISCTNGDNGDVKMKITKIVSAYLGIPSNRIEIVSIR